MTNSKTRYRASDGAIVKLLEADADEETGAGKYSICIIQPGPGSSGIYLAENLAVSAPLFAAGTQMYMDHPAYDDRPERSVKDLAGKFLEDATIGDDGALYTSIEVYPSYNQVIREKWDDIGVSINAWSYEPVSPEGIVPPFDGVTSVDFVTKAGAGGALIEVLESQREDPADNEHKEETRMAELEESATKIAESVDRLLALMTTQAEEAAKAKKDEEDMAKEDEKKKQKESASIAESLEAARAIEAAKLPDASVARVTTMIESGVDYKQAIADEQDYVKQITEAVKAGAVDEKNEHQEAYKVTGFRTAKGGK